MSGEQSIGTEIGKTTCSACGFERARVKVAKNHTLTVSCSECGCSAFVKSPKAVAALRGRIGAAPAPAGAANQSSFADFLKA